MAWWALADHKHTASRGHARLDGIGTPVDTIQLWESISRRKALAMEWHLIFAAFRQALISFRLEQTSATRQQSYSREPSIGLQWLACLLGPPLGQPMTLPFVGLER